MKERTEFDFGRLNSLANRRLLCTGKKKGEKCPFEI